MQLLTVCTWAVHSVPVRVCAMPTGGVRQLCERTTPGILSQHSQVEPSCCLRLYRVAACRHRPAAVQLPKAHSSDSCACNAMIGCVGSMHGCNLIKSRDPDQDVARGLVLWPNGTVFNRWGDLTASSNPRTHAHLRVFLLHTCASEELQTIVVTSQCVWGGVANFINTHQQC
jgi:hypothetical protein